MLTSFNASTTCALSLASNLKAFIVAINVLALFSAVAPASDTFFNIIACSPRSKASFAS